MTKLKYHPEVEQDLRELDGKERKDALKKLEKLRENPEAGEPLQNRFGMDLRGYRKLYADGKNVRIVYRVGADRVIRIVYVLTVGKRKEMEVYKEALRRIGEV